MITAPIVGTIALVNICVNENMHKVALTASNRETNTGNIVS